MLARDDTRPIGMPTRVCERTKFFRGHCSLLLVIEIHDENVIAAIGVANVGQQLTIGTKSRLHFLRQSSRQALSPAARDG